jgi:hypothetical protein
VLEFEKVDLEAKVESFNFRYIKELNPLISIILKIRKKIYEKLKKHGINDDKYNDLEKKLADNELKYNKAIEDPFFDLSDDKQVIIRNLYRDLVKFCHPNSPDCVFEDELESSKVFSLLNDAYKHGDIEKVLEIKDKLLGKQKIDTNKEYDKLIFLQAKLESLKRTHQRIVEDLKQIRNSEVYLIITEIDDWDVYFEEQKKVLEDNYEQEKSKYVDL